MATEDWLKVTFSDGLLDIDIGPRLVALFCFTAGVLVSSCLWWAFS